MARSTVYNKIANEESAERILPENKQLSSDFLDYLKSIDRSKTTIEQYRNDLRIFFVWNLEANCNKRFTDITKRDFARFQSNALENWQWSSSRIRRVKSVLSSLSNYVENILDEEAEYAGYRSVIKKIESPVKTTVREKTVFNPEEVEALLSHLIEEEKYMQACVVALAAYSGRRKSELPRFKVSYFTEDNVIFGSLYKTNEPVQTKGRGSKGKMLYLYVLKKPFDPYLKLWMDERERLNIESEWLFPDPNDPTKQLRTEIMDGWIDSYSKFLGKDFYFHALRHYFTTQLLKQNIPADVVKEIVGWESIDMVSVYNDRSIDESIGMYFDENGIRKVDTGDLGSL